MSNNQGNKNSMNDSWLGNNQNIQGMFMNETVVCANELYDKSLVDSGKVKSLNEAKGTPRHLVCTCPKCMPKY